MSISVEALRGYLLEEALAFLIRGTGYTLLVDKKQDPLELDNKAHGLVVKGRGSVHQADVLGELNWIPAFTFPIRLFVEAKYRSSRTGIGPVRNAVGILEDINQNFFHLKDSNILTKRYSYHYALFSASGFTQDAVDMAIAHRISLIDLSGPDFEELRNAIDSSAKLVIANFCNLDENHNPTRNSMIKSIRMFIRYYLETWAIGYNDNINKSMNEVLGQALENYFQTIRSYNELYVGMAKGPFLLILKADNPEVFLSYARKNPNHHVSIRWNANDNNGRNWHIQPEYSEDKYYHLSFSLPRQLGDLIFESEDPVRSAIHIKRTYFSDITIYRSSYEKDELFRLQWNR